MTYVNSPKFLKLPWLVLFYFILRCFFFFLKKNINNDKIQNINAHDNNNNVFFLKIPLLYHQILQINILFNDNNDNVMIF